jgi:hypothetical protein
MCALFSKAIGSLARDLTELDASATVEAMRQGDFSAEYYAGVLSMRANEGRAGGVGKMQYCHY